MHGPDTHSLIMKMRTTVVKMVMMMMIACVQADNLRAGSPHNNVSAGIIYTTRDI